MIYFLQCQCSVGYIKIGHTIDLDIRLAKLHQSSPYEIVVVRVIPGGIDVEKELHERFVDDRHRGEWFKPSNALVGYILEAEDQCLGGYPPPETNEITIGRRLDRARVTKVRAQFREQKLLSEMG